MLKELINLWMSDDLLQQSWNQSYKMLEIDRKMFLEAVRILRESDDTDVNREIRNKDKLVNEYEREVRRKVMTHCTIMGSSTIPSGMVLISIIIDIERIGDYCKNILDLAELHPQRLQLSNYEDIIAEIEKEIMWRFKETISALTNSDAEKARNMMKTYKIGLSGICDQVANDLVQRKVEGILPGDEAAIALYVRYLKRIGAHLNNIVTSVVNPFDWIGFKRKNK
ncbi:MAG: hypothetical protein K8R68_07330 [Bacteroidales bacterium]|nr:hypothetical protein [Bacteroidales bacterium]